MRICHAEIINFKALQNVSIPLNQFSVLLGENDTGKTTFLKAIDIFFQGKKIEDPDFFYRKDKTQNISITLTFENLPEKEGFRPFFQSDERIVIRKEFSFNKSPIVKAILDGGQLVDIPKSILDLWFSSDNYHFIPVRRDLNVQFSMAKSALLGKILRAKMKSAIEKEETIQSLLEVEKALKFALGEPKDVLQNFLQQQLQNSKLKLDFDNVKVDPIEGVSFDIRLTDDRIEDILIENRGAGTQNNLIIALFRLVADSDIGQYIIFAMEEPENSLHPKAQRQLLSVIRDISERSQVIVTTHSPVFIERSKFENNIYLSRTIKGNTVAKTFNNNLLPDLRKDLGIRPSDALLKGGGNCALLVEGNTEEEAFPVFMSMMGMSDFSLGIAIINLQGCDQVRTRNTVNLLLAYDIPCIIVLDNDAKETEIAMNKEKDIKLCNIKKVFRLKKGTFEDYFPLSIIAEIINTEMKAQKPITENDFDSSKSGQARIKDIQKVMYESGAGSSISHFKRMLGDKGAKIMRDRKFSLDPEIEEIFNELEKVAKSN